MQTVNVSHVVWIFYSLPNTLICLIFDVISYYFVVVKYIKIFLKFSSTAQVTLLYVCCSIAGLLKFFCSATPF